MTFSKVRSGVKVSLGQPEFNPGTLYHIMQERGPDPKGTPKGP